MVPQVCVSCCVYGSRDVTRPGPHIVVNTVFATNGWAASERASNKVPLYLQTSTQMT